MTEVDIFGMLVEGLRLMLIGMGIVFSFLLLLVGLLRLMSSLAQRLAPAEVAPQAAAAAVPRPAEFGDQGELVAVISAAVARWRSRHGPG